jgi:ABC-type iron transport system FetAB ATPase subunit
MKKTPWGWLKASVERVKRFSSMPKDLSLDEKLAILDEENELVKQALIENYIIENV